MILQQRSISNGYAPLFIVPIPYGREIDLSAYVKEQMEHRDGIVSIAIVEDSPGGGHYLGMRSKEYSASFAPQLVLD